MSPTDSEDPWSGLVSLFLSFTNETLAFFQSNLTCGNQVCTLDW
jgi:hypothetical protein